MFTRFMNRNFLAPHLNDQMPFGGNVVPIETRNPEIEVIERVQPSLQQRLLAVPIADPKLRQRRQTLVSELAVATMKAEEFLEEIATQRNANLEGELEEIRKRGREQEAVLAELKVDHEHKVLAVRNLKEQSENLAERIRDLRQARISRWASAAERKNHQKKIDALTDELRSVNNEVAKAGQAQMLAFATLQEAQEAMRKISDAEIRVRGALSGRAFSDPEYGLRVEPS